MKKLSVYTVIAAVLLLVEAGIWQGCKPKKEEDPSNPTTPTTGTQPDKYFVTRITSTSNDIGLLINDPAKKEQMVVFGKKNASGNLIAITHLMQILPETKLWVLHEFNENMLPKKSTFSSGHELIYSDYSTSKKTFSVKAIEQKTSSTIWEKKEILLEANFFTTVTEYQKLTVALKNGRLTSTSGLTALPTAGEAAYIGANAFGCVMGVIGLASSGGVMLWFGAYNTWQNCKGTYEAIENLRNGEPAFGCMTQDDIVNSASGYGETIINFVLGGGSLGSFALGMAPAMMANAIQAGSCNSSARTAGGTNSDPIISGLDGGRVFLHPAGEFWAIRSKNDEFAAQIRFEPVGLRPVSTTTSLAVRTGKDVVSITVKPLVIHVNGLEIKSDFSTYMLQDKAYLTRPAANRYEIITTWGDLIEVRVLPTFNLSWYVRTLNEKRKNQVEGLLGQFNDNPEDDFQDKANNTYTVGRSPRTDFYKKYANDWRITQNQSILVYPTGKTTASYTKLEFPEKAISLFDFELADRQKAEQTCRNAGITGEPDLSNCMMDVLATGMNEMAEQMGIAFQLKQESAAYFQRLAPYAGKPSQAAVAVTVGDKIYAGLGSFQLDWAMYDPATDKWTTKAPFSAGKTSFVRMGTFVIGKKVYCLGGVIDNTATNALWEYDTDTDKWTRRKDLPGVARYNIAAFATGGKGYALFGTIGWGLSENDYPTKSTLYEYDPATDTWVTKSDFPAKPRGNNITNGEFNGLVMNINGRIFVGNGSGSSTVFSDWYEYIPTRDVWEKRANSFGGTYYFSVGNIGYVLNHGARSYVMSYDATTDTWSKWPGKEIFIPLQRNVARGVYQAPTLNGKSYLGLGNEIKDWWSFMP